ncbi:MAG TPA: STAS domain-containing protein [Stellaceae bacterium]|nr:STAS domain-containing protein [Stellaceae bacterium]
MATAENVLLPQLIAKHRDALLAAWIDQQRAANRGSNEDQAELRDYSARFLDSLRAAAATGQFEDIATPSWSEARHVLEEVSRARALRGATPTQTATFVFSLKAPLFDLLGRELGKDAVALAREVWIITLLLDKFGLYTTEVFQKSREGVIQRQQDELLELSTPVVTLWQGVLALPLIGTLDSNRTQVVMENLLQTIVSTGAQIAIIDITGVPTVDTLVAQHLLKTVSAARLMGADCIISGIRPQIAQTIVHLGVELNVVSKATMADAFALALRRLGKTVVDRAKPTAQANDAKLAE